MPNGGSDCCGTCWFDARNKGEAGYDHAGDEGTDFCTIRNLPIEDAFHTYCGNHPLRRPERDATPIGPVFRGDSGGTRVLWKPSPDTEKIRQHLLGLAGAMLESPRSEYPIGISADEAVVWQLGEFREARAADPLRRIASFDPAAAESGRRVHRTFRQLFLLRLRPPFGRTREQLVQLAKEALKKIEPLPAGGD